VGQGKRTDLDTLSNNGQSSIDAAQDAAEEVNVSRQYIFDAQNVADKAPEVFELMREGKVNMPEAKLLASTTPDVRESALKKKANGKAKTVREAVRQAKVECAPEPSPIPNGKCRVIYADPPWSYGNTMPDGTTEPGDYYPLMSIEEICAMPVKEIAECEAVLFLWVTSPILAEAFAVVSAWGFKYKASFIWDKIKHNMGHYNSVRHEFLLVCTRGSCQPDVRKLFDSVVSVERTEHSVKPDIFREMIDTLYPNGRRIELFARRSADGWERYGNEVR
jgi:N6-adenosine-specific RNA methylase IME4